MQSTNVTVTGRRMDRRTDLRWLRPSYTKRRAVKCRKLKIDACVRVTSDNKEKTERRLNTSSNMRAPVSRITRSLLLYYNKLKYSKARLIKKFDFDHVAYTSESSIDWTWLGYSTVSSPIWYYQHTEVRQRCGISKYANSVTAFLQRKICCWC